MADYYCDPSIGSDSGAGTIGDPWGAAANVWQYAVDAIVSAGKGSAGDIIHTKSDGTVTYVASTALDVTSYAPSASVQLLFVGYSETAWDGGRCTVDMNGAQGTTGAAADDALFFAYCDFSNSVTDKTRAFNLDNYITMFRCTFTGAGTGSSGFLHSDNYSHVLECKIVNTDVSGNSCTTGAASSTIGCVFEEPDGQYAMGGSGALIAYNIIHSYGGYLARMIVNHGCMVWCNSIYSTAIFGSFYRGYWVANGEQCAAINNYVENMDNGFSQDTTGQHNHWLYNQAYNCTTPFERSPNCYLISDEGNITASGPGLFDPVSPRDDDANTDWRPTEALRGYSFPTNYWDADGEIVDPLRTDQGCTGAIQLSEIDGPLNHIPQMRSN